MVIGCFEDTDTLYIEFSPSEISETRDLDENTLLELDEADNIGALTFEHGAMRTDLEHVTFEGVAA